MGWKGGPRPGSGGGGGLVGEAFPLYHKIINLSITNSKLICRSSNINS